MGDLSLMPFGVYRGYPLSNVPAGYLLFLYDNVPLYQNLKQYIERNMDILKAQFAEEEHTREILAQLREERRNKKDA